MSLDDAKPFLQPGVALQAFDVDTLEGLALDQAVALCDPRNTGLEFGEVDSLQCGFYREAGTPVACVYITTGNFRTHFRVRKKPSMQHATHYSPIEDWAIAGTLIERFDVQWKKLAPNSWLAFIQSLEATTPEVEATGSTQRTAALRCIVKSIFGATVLLPTSMASPRQGQ